MGKTVSKVTSPRKRVWFSKEFKLEARRLISRSTRSYNKTESIHSTIFTCVPALITPSG